MSSGYEALLSMAKSYLTDDVKQITEDDVREAVNTVSAICRKRHDISDDDIQKAISELLYFYAVTMTDDDAELFKPIFAPHGGQIPLKLEKKKAEIITGILINNIS